MQSEWVALARDVFEWVKSGLLPFTLFLVVFLIWICRDTIKQFPQTIFDLITFRSKSKYPQFSNKDIKTHRVMNTLKFWLNGGIQSLSYDNYYIASLMISDHKDAPDYIKAKEEMYKLTIELDGTLSGEHGIGSEKKKYIPMAIDKVALEYMKKIKAVFDPKNILNPDKIF